MIHRIKDLSLFIKSKSGRNNKGNITNYNKGGGYKFFYYLYDNFKKVYDIPYIIVKSKVFLYKSFFIDLICYSNGYLSYIRSTEGVINGTWVVNSLKRFRYNDGDAVCLKFITIGTLLHSIESNFFNGAIFCRSKGSYGKLLCQYNKYTLIELPSKEQRLFLNTFKGVIGQVAFNVLNFEKYLLVNCKAGTKRKKGYRPHVRGIAKNSVDHPNGGRTKGGSSYKDMWGNLSLGHKTRKYKSKYILTEKEKILLK